MAHQLRRASPHLSLCYFLVAINASAAFSVMPRFAPRLPFPPTSSQLAQSSESLLSTLSDIRRRGFGCPSRGVCWTTAAHVAHSDSTTADATTGMQAEEKSSKQRRKERTPEDIERLRAERKAAFEKRQQKIALLAEGKGGLPKMRQHVNPLAPQYRTPIPTPEWATIYENPTQDLHLDLGCAAGQLLMELARRDPTRNHLGVEIREALPVRARRWVEEEGLRNAHFVAGNINVSVESLLDAYPGELELVSVLMPDPWFKKKHHKRRLLRSDLVEKLAARMKAGARFLVQSDVLEAAEDMVQILDASSSFSTWDGQWCEPALPIYTEREGSCISKGMPIYRAVFTRQ